jgi:hypothetical protein
MDDRPRSETVAKTAGNTSGYPHADCKSARSDAGCASTTWRGWARGGGHIRRNRSGEIVQTEHSTRDYSDVIQPTQGARREVNDMEASAEDRWLSRQELADRYGVPVKTPAEWASKGTGPRYAKFGRHVRYRLRDVIDWESRRFAEDKRSSA